MSPRNPKRLVTADEFNAFLEDVCEEQGITDAYGKHTKITMYSLRHANGAEMASSNGFSREEFTRAFAHNSRYSDAAIPTPASTTSCKLPHSTQRRFAVC